MFVGSCVAAAALTAFSVVRPVAVSAQAPAVVVRDAWVRPPAPSKDETALYLTIENKTGAPRAIVSVMSDQAKMGEMHKEMMDGKMMKMMQLQKIEVPANGTTVLKPNDLHIMLMGLKTKPAVGDIVSGTLKLDDGTMVPFKAEVRK
jgi:copper(I)-binding protein